MRVGTDFIFAFLYASIRAGPCLQVIRALQRPQRRGRTYWMTLIKPIRVTFTGADPSCSVDALIGLLEEAPGLELAFLYSETRQGSGRYPPAAWIRETARTIEQ